MFWGGVSSCYVAVGGFQDKGNGVWKRKAEKEMVVERIRLTFTVRSTRSLRYSLLPSYLPPNEIHLLKSLNNSWRI